MLFHFLCCWRKPIAKILSRRSSGPLVETHPSGNGAPEIEPLLKELISSL